MKAFRVECRWKGSQQGCVLAGKGSVVSSGCGCVEGVLPVAVEGVPEEISKMADAGEGQED